MTEIAGIIGAGQGTHACMQRMIAAMGDWPHDYQRSWTGGGAGLAASVLRTTEESLDVWQPLADEDERAAIVFDGYLTNNQELRRDLIQRGARLRTASDEELVLRAYQTWGQDCAAKIEGEFAFIVIDQHTRRLFCARDHIGFRPLYYAEDTGHLLVASSLATLLAGLDRQPSYNLDFLAETMIGEVHSTDQTAWSGVFRLKPAHAFTWEGGSSQCRRYYSLPHAAIRKYKSDGEYVEEYKAVFADSVRRTSRTHLPLAFEVSGGLDSTAIFCLASDMMGQGRIDAPSIAGFTLRGARGSVSDEVEYARETAEFLGRRIAESELFRPDLDWFTDQVQIEKDLPTYTNAAQSILMERAIAQTGSRVVINGMGGDQWLDGSLAYYDQNLGKLAFGRLLRNARRDVRHRGFAPIAALVARKALLALTPDRLRAYLKSLRPGFGMIYGEEHGFLAPEYLEKTRAAKLEYLSGLPANEVSRINQLKFDGIGNQRAFDLMYRQRSRSGLEGRSPMLTRAFIEFCSCLPEDVKLRGGQTKWVHRRAMQGLMPVSVIERDDKAAFPERSHDANIRALIETHRTGAIADLIDAEQLSAFCELRQEGDIDDEWGWPYWGIYMVTAFLSADETKSY